MNTSREQPPFPVHRRLFGWVIAHNPTEFYLELERPTVTELPDSLLSHVSMSPTSPALTIRRDATKARYLDQTLDALGQDLHDVSRLTCLGLASSDEKLRTATLRQQDLFLATARGVAILSQEDISAYFHVQHRRLSEQGMTAALFQDDAHELVQEEMDEKRGCPFAKTGEGISSPDHLFTRFVKWAALLTIEASLDESDDRGLAFPLPAVQRRLDLGINT